MEKHEYIDWKNHRLTATVHYPATAQQKKYPVVIICHGFTSNRIGVDRLFVKTAQHLSAGPFIVVRFDYAGCGESEGTYGELTFPDFLEQTKAVISFAEQLPQADSSAITLLGHSLGGAVAVHTALEDGRVHELVLWSAVGRPFEDIIAIVGEDEYRNLPKQGYVDHLGYSLSAGFLHSLRAFEPLKQIAQFQGDVLHLHGKEDQEISPDYCSQYYSRTAERSVGHSAIHLIPGANHTFSSIAGYRQLIGATASWLSGASRSSHLRQAEG